MRTGKARGNGESSMTQVIEIWSRWADLNRRHTDYESVHTEIRNRRIYNGLRLISRLSFPRSNCANRGESAGVGVSRCG